MQQDSTNLSHAPDEPDPRQVELAAKFNAGVLTVADMEALPPPEPLIDGWLFRDTLALVYGAPDSSKTFFALDLALRVASGWDFLGAWSVQQGLVLYVAAEGRSAMHLRIQAWTKAKGQHPNDHFRLYPDTVDLRDPDAVAELVAWCSLYKPAMVVIDTLASCLVGADENTSRDMTVAIESTRKVREASRATVVLVHHTTKDGLSERGSGALRGACDTILPVKAEGPDGEAITVGTRDDKTKQKDGPRPMPILLKREEIDLGTYDGRPITSCVLVEVKGFDRLQKLGADGGRAAKLLQLLQESFAQTGASSKQLRETLGMSDSEVSRAMNLLLERKEVTREGPVTRPWWRAAPTKAA